VGKRNIPEDGWSKEGEAWFDSLDWEDAQFLLTRQGTTPRTEEDEARLTRLRESYESATGETWESSILGPRGVFTDASLES
jgi:hypothetical protein